jgi:hypothetical protein
MSREFMNGGSWTENGEKRPFFKRIRGNAFAGNRKDKSGNGWKMVCQT